MTYTNEEAVGKLLDSFKTYYNIEMCRSDAAEPAGMSAGMSAAKPVEPAALSDAKSVEPAAPSVAKPVEPAAPSDAKSVEPAAPSAGRNPSLPLLAVCEYFEHSEKYILHKKAEVWSAECEEFLFLFETDKLTLELFEQCRDMALEEGMKKAHIGPGHMYTYITPVFVCSEITPEAAMAIKKCHIYKSFLFSFHGWMDFHTAAFATESDRILSNRSGRCVEKTLKQVLFPGKSGKSRLGL